MNEFIHKTPLHIWNDYDTGLYHLQNIKWINLYPIPFGLGHVNSAFAFNSIWFNTAAALKLPYLDLYSVFSANAILIFLVLLLIFEKSLYLYEAQTRTPSFNEKMLKIFLCLFILSTLLFNHLFLHSNFYLFGRISSPTTDLPAALFAFLTIFLSFELTILNHQKDKLKTIAILLPLITLFTIMIKASALPIITFPLFALFYFYLQNKVFKLKKITIILVTVFIFTAPWIARSYLISGCGLYPLSFTCVKSLDWGIDIENVKARKEALNFFAKIDWTAEDPTAKELRNDLASLAQDWNWFPGWWNWYWKTGLFIRPFSLLLLALLLISNSPLIISFKEKRTSRNSFFFLLFLFSTIGALVFAKIPVILQYIIISIVIINIFYSLILIKQKKIDYNIMRKEFFVFLTFALLIFICLLFWFFNGPIPRYGLAYIVSLPLLLLSFAFCLIKIDSFFNQHVDKFIFLGLCFFGFKVFSLGKEFTYNDWLLEWPRIPKIEYFEQTSSSGEPYFSPPQFDQCWDATLPCVPHKGMKLNFEKNGDRYYFRKNN